MTRDAALLAIELATRLVGGARKYSTKVLGCDVPAWCRT